MRPDDPVTTATDMAAPSPGCRTRSASLTLSYSPSVLDQAANLVALESIPAVEEPQLHEVDEADDLAAEHVHQLGGRGGGAAGGEQVVRDQDALARRDGVLLHLDSVRPVLQRILRADR